MTSIRVSVLRPRPLILAGPDLTVAFILACRDGPKCPVEPRALDRALRGRERGLLHRLAARTHTTSALVPRGELGWADPIVAPDDLPFEPKSLDLTTKGPHWNAALLQR